MSNAVAEIVHMKLNSLCQDILMRYDFGVRRKGRNMAANVPAQALASAGPTLSIDEHGAKGDKAENFQLREAQAECDQLAIDGELLSGEEGAEDVEDDVDGRSQDE